ncbi:MAG: hypothetical protein RM021_029390 [Nostoc sp. EkiNYC01]|nr:hypothetical protein [Nostoc sp. EkiNYC01]
MNIRDVASHGDLNGKSIKERIEAKGKSIKIYLRSLNNGINKEKIQTLFIQFVVNQKGIIVNGKPEQGWAYITLYNLKNSLLYQFTLSLHIIESRECRLDNTKWHVS